MKRVLLVANDSKPEAIPLAERARRLIGDRAEVLEIVTGRDADLSAHAPDLVVVFGGDGTVLNVVRRLGDTAPLLLTVNLGRLGYLAEVNPEDLESELTRVLAGEDVHVSERIMLRGRLLDEDGAVVWEGHAVNEIVAAPMQPGRMIEIEVEADGRPLTRFSGDGLLLATPTGSTAYALSAGGPVVNPEVRAILLVPLCPHQLGNRPLLMGPEETVSIRQLSGRSARAASDGRQPREFNPGQRLVVDVSHRRVRLIMGRNIGRYDILRRKLGWGGETRT